MYHRPKCSICSKEKILFILIVYVVCSYFYLSILQRLMCPEDIDCSVYEKNLDDYDSPLDLKLPEEFNNFSTKKALVKSQNWTKLARDTYVYSAYHGKCPQIFSHSECVQLIGITQTETNSKSFIPNLKCAFKTKREIKGRHAFIERVPESHFLSFTAAIFYCDLKNFQSESMPRYVTLYDSSPFEWVPIENVGLNELSQRISVSLCVRPLYGHYHNLYLAEFFAYYATMGVDHFTLYNYNASDSTMQFLNFASTNLSIEVLSWNIPLSNSEVHEYGQLVFTQDCLARNRYKHSHTIIVDLDEFIVPKKHQSIVELVKYLDDYYPHAGSYIVPMVLFCEEFPHQTKESLLILNRNKRQKTPWAYGFRSKYIARPDRVRQGGIHLVWQLEESFSEEELPPSLVLLHHYKRCCGMTQTWFLHLFSFHVVKDAVVIDDSLIRHSSKILNQTLLRLILNH